MKATFRKYLLRFKRPSGTSRGILTEKETWFLMLHDNGKSGVGECGLLRTLSWDDRPEYEEKMQWVCDHIDLGKEKLWEELVEFPSIQFGLEMAFTSLEAEDPFLLFPSAFTTGNAGIEINGLVWMGTRDFMKQQIEQKIQAGFKCIKLKIGAIDFETELSLLQYIRSQFRPEDIEIRVDANGAFSPSEALEKLHRLSRFDLHSIEQPIRQGQWETMAKLCEESPLPIALDEELIGITGVTKKRELIQTIRPHYLIFKPSLIGGIRGIQEWIEVARPLGIHWWITSALESNVGLNAIAQYTYLLENPLPQGLGTGGLYTNNVSAPLEVRKGHLWYEPKKDWKFNLERK